MNRFIIPLRFIFRFIVPAFFAVVLVLKIVSSPEIGLLRPIPGETLDILYKILLSSLVGYFTNFLAITMLFKPKNKSRHGIQGLIPGNQEQIAESLGDGISDNFFNAADLIEYVNKNDLISNAVSSMKEYVDVTFDNPQHQVSITKWILNAFQTNSPKIFYLLLQLSEANLTKYLRGRIDLESLTKDVIRIIERNIEDGTIDLKAISRELTTFLHNNVPELSEAIFKQVNKAIEQQSVIKRNLLKLAARTFDFDQDMIEDYLYEMVSSPDFRIRLYKNLEGLVKRLTEYLDSEPGMKQLDIYYHKAIFELMDKIKEKGVPYMLLETESFLKKSASWKKIELYLKKGLNFLEKTLEELIADERFDSFLTRSMPKILEKIKIAGIVTEKVKAYDTDKLEKMVLDASGEHLSAIEVLGGVLGGFAGIALFDPLLFLYILGPILGLGFIEYLLTKRQRKKEQ
ncbi:MAG: DUF445 family protein [SAR324 cluster bacterium]|nr:DUF445 family protein [SAR324 cluster bacterium]